MRNLATLAVLTLAAAPLTAQCEPEEVFRHDRPMSSTGFPVPRIHGDLAVAGDPNQGFVFVYERVGGAWEVAHGFTHPAGSAAGRNYSFGAALALDGDTLVVGAPSEAFPSYPGAIYVYERDLGGPGAWGLRERLAGFPGLPGEPGLGPRPRGSRDGLPGSASSVVGVVPRHPPRLRLRRAGPQSEPGNLRLADARRVRERARLRHAGALRGKPASRR